MFCVNCGKSLDDGAKFCNHCGKAVQVASPEDAVLGALPLENQAPEEALFDESWIERSASDAQEPPPASPAPHKKKLTVIDEYNAFVDAGASNQIEYDRIKRKIKNADRYRSVAVFIFGLAFLYSCLFWFDASLGWRDRLLLWIPGGCIIGLPGVFLSWIFKVKTGINFLEPGSNEDEQFEKLYESMIGRTHTKWLDGVLGILSLVFAIYCFSTSGIIVALKALMFALLASGSLIAFFRGFRWWTLLLLPVPVFLLTLLFSGNAFFGNSDMEVPQTSSVPSAVVDAASAVASAPPPSTKADTFDVATVASPPTPSASEDVLDEVADAVTDEVADAPAEEPVDFVPEQPAPQGTATIVETSQSCQASGDIYDYDVNIPVILDIATSCSDTAALASTLGIINDAIGVDTQNLMSYCDTETELTFPQSIYFGYEIVADNELFFSLRTDETWGGGGSTSSSNYYHIYKPTNEILTLAALFDPGYDYISIISENIRTQMRAQMAANDNVSYFVDDFYGIQENQPFYFNDSGDLTFIFNEYQVAPGYMGIVEFSIPYEVFA